MTAEHQTTPPSPAIDTRRTLPPGKARPSMVLEARRLGLLGLRILPVCPAKRKPLAKNWQKLATSELDEITQAWKHWPTALIGAAAGRGTHPLHYGHFVVDIDTRNGGQANLDALQNALGALPQGQFTVTSPGGFHIHFALPLGLQIKNFVGKDGWGEGIDVRGCTADGSPSGMSIMPPSVRADGLSYAFGPSVDRPYEVSYPLDCPTAYLWLCVFNAREREQLASAGVRGPADIDAPIARWAEKGKEIIAREFRQGAMPLPETPISIEAQARVVAYVECAAVARQSG